MQTQTAEPTTQREVVFDEQGQTVEIVETAAETEVPETHEAPEQVEAQAQAPAQATTKGTGKYRIGERLFETQEAALDYAQSQVSALETEQQIANAYSQGLRDAQPVPGVQPHSVTPLPPPPPELNTEELYTNPQQFLDKFANKIKNETRAESDHRQLMRDQSEQIWSEFTNRHPMLADFRTEVENFTSANQQEVRAIIATKGRPAGYDYVATKLKSRFETYSNAIKPTRELPNTVAPTPAPSRADGVTPPAVPKKGLSFADQIRSIRKRR